VTPARLHESSASGLQLDGDLTAESVVALLPSLPAGPGEWHVSLGGVERIDSAGLALLIEWRRRLSAAGGTLVLDAVPAALTRLARISSVDTLLGLESIDAGNAQQ
jgi:phospholipid transport system transporter-binding protein